MAATASLRAGTSVCFSRIFRHLRTSIPLSTIAANCLEKIARSFSLTFPLLKNPRPATAFFSLRVAIIYPLSLSF